MNHSKYIILYSDEFEIDVWVRYMDILKLPYTTSEVKIAIKQVITIR